jgi:predicted transcriptional regulator
VCSKHGGMATQVREAARRRYEFAAVEGEIGKLLRDADMPQQHPLDGLLEVVRHSGAMMRMLSLQCAALAERGVVGVTDDDFGKPHYYMKSEGLVGVDHEGDGAPHVLVTLYERWSLLHMRACKTALDANIDERLVRNAEATSEKFFRVFAQAVEAADLTVEQQARLRNTLAAGLRAMSPIDAKMMEAQGA